MKRCLFFLLSMLFLMNAEAARMEVITCPREVICHSSQTHDCRATTDANYWGIDPSASASRVNAKHYNLVSASTAQQHSPGTCVYMNFRQGQRNTFVVLASRHSLLPLRDRHTRWFLDRQSHSWICPKMNSYKKINPQRCAYVSDITSHRRVDARRDHRDRRYSRNRDR